MELRAFRELEEKRGEIALEPHLEFYYQAFNELSGCRANHRSPDGEGMIPWSAIDRYAERYDISGESFEVLRKYIEAMDLAYVRFRDKKTQEQIDAMNKKNQKQAASGNKQRHRRY